MGSPDLHSVTERLRALRANHDPQQTRDIKDFHEFFKTTKVLVTSAYKRAGLMPSSDAIDQETIKVFRDVLGLDDENAQYNFRYSNE